MTTSRPEIYDYYIKLCEDNPESLKNIALEEVKGQKEKFISNAYEVAD